MAEDQLKQHRQRYRALAAQLLELGFVSPGSLILRHHLCGKPGCRCQAEPPQPHGPYYQWTRKVAGKTITRRLTRPEAELYTEWIANQRRLMAIVADMEEVSRQAIEVILRKQPSS